MRRKQQFNYRFASPRICLGDTAVRIYGAPVWNKTSNINAQYNFKNCYGKQPKKFDISKYTAD